MYFQIPNDNKTIQTTCADFNCISVVFVKICYLSVVLIVQLIIIKKWPTAVELNCTMQKVVLFLLDWVLMHGTLIVCNYSFGFQAVYISELVECTWNIQEPIQSILYAVLHTILLDKQHKDVIQYISDILHHHT